MHADLVRGAKERELGAWKQFKVFSLVQMGAQIKDVVDTRWVLTWKEVEGKKTALACLVARGYQDPEIKDGSVDIAGCANERSLHLQLAPLGAPQKWRIRSSEIKNAFLKSDGFGREEFVHSSCEWDTRRARKLRAPRYYRDDAPVAFRRSLLKYSVNSVGSPSSVSPKFDASSFGPRLYAVCRKSGAGVGSIATYIHDILGRGGPDML